MNAVRYIALPARIDRVRLSSRLAAAFAIEDRDAVARRRRYLDTFDGRLWRAGLQLVLSGGGYRLERRSDGRCLAAAEADARAPKLFASDLPAGRLRESVAPLIGMRALILLVELALEERPFVLRDRSRAIVARGVWTRIRAGRRRAGEDGARFLALAPVRGRDGTLRRAADLLAAEGVDPRPVDLLAWALARVGLETGAFGAKGVVRFAPGTTSHEALSRILRPQARMMRRTRAGVVADVDSEFLHDFRVAVRRTRTALALGKGVLPAGVRRRFRREFADLARTTGRLRDLDVLLMRRDAYGRLLPTDLRGGLDRLFVDLAAERRREQRAVARRLRSAAFRALLEDWDRILAGDAPAGAAPGPRAERPVHTLARRRLRRQLRRTRTAAAAVAVDAPESAFHRLRLEVKTLRYLLEFFSCLYPPPRTRPLIRELKTLQGELGELNDLRVQRDELTARLASREDGGALRPRPAAAVGGLITALRERQRAARRRCVDAVAGFTSDGQRRLYRKLISP